VSSILKALKKLEKEHPQQEEVVTWPRKIDTKSAVSKNAKNTLFFKKIVGFFFVVVILGGGLWLFLSQKSFWMDKYSAVTAFFGQKTQEERKASVQVRKKVAKKSVPVPGGETIEKETPRVSTGRTPRPGLRKSRIGPGKRSERLHPVKRESDRKMPARVQKTDENTLNPVSKAETEIDKQTIVASTEPSDPGLEHRKTPTLKEIEKPISIEIKEDKRFASAEIMDDSTLELQAIAWSSDVEKRIAVISGRVVKEGAIIKGFTIIRIGKEKVFVADGSELRKLLFTSK